MLVSSTKLKKYLQHRQGVQDLRKPEIRNLDKGWVVLCEKDVLRLQVSVHNTHAMHVLIANKQYRKMLDISATYCEGVANLIRDVLRFRLDYKGDEHMTT